MTSLVMRELLQARQVVYQQLRFSSNRVNIQRPKPPPYPKQQFLRITVPRLQPDDKPLIDKCRKQREVIPPSELSPLDHIYAEEVRQFFRESKVSAIYARNPMSVEDFNYVKVMFFKANMKLVVRKRGIMQEALGGTEFVNLLPLFESDNLMAFSPDLNIKELFRVSRREPRVTLQAAVVENRILSVSQLMTLLNVEDIQTARAHLVQVMQSSAQNVHRGLEAHQNMLLHHLQQRVEQLKDSSNVGTSNIKGDPQGS